ncbi:transcriptional regulator GlxA family with amidase domain [Motilibacter rhizosphaerae]|uniref:Transcriptional regulator GlxA family with amidase domain n=1 Tax=Motilibacter rhizosphaerae TaxID=598652 RepID=A0A4Q7NPL2_9ACTN|nr:DJ-1/PfpI family protein [Motilibacter rhizosphaerae]RZS87209.1 transcriptional regulator GlxA family with amidase domain [Motilibacter rhizosphaerae]
MAPHRVAVLALDRVVTLDLAIPAHVFSYTDELPYVVTVCGVRAGQVRTTAGFPVVATAGLGALRRADTVVVPGFHAPPDGVPEEVLRALRSCARRGARVMSICTGAFALAAAGLLDGRRATTHWMHAEALAREYPLVDVDPRVLYVDEGQILTSAGVASGLDLCLHVIRQDLGAEVAASIARRVVVAPHRDGGQAQYLDAPLPAEAGDSLAATRSWAAERLAEPLTVADLAAHAHVSPRTLARRWSTEAGCSPLRWLLVQRVGLARRLLETTDLPLELVAGRAGLGSADNLRLHFRKEVGTTPSAYRRTFRGVG